MSNGKGDRVRPVDRDKFDENFDQIQWMSKPAKSSPRYYAEVRIAGVEGRSGKRALVSALLAAKEQLWQELGDEAFIDVVIEKQSKNGEFVEIKLPKGLRSD